MKRTQLKPAITAYIVTVEAGYFPGDTIKKQLVKALIARRDYNQDKKNVNNE